MEGESGNFTLHGRIAGKPCRLEHTGPNGRYFYHEGNVTLEIESGVPTRVAPSTTSPAATTRVELGRYHTLVALLTGITGSAKVHQVNSRLLAVR